MSKSRFSEQEHENMIMAVAQGQDEFTEEDVEKLLEWIIKVQIDMTFADMVLEGKLSVDTRGPEFAFRKKD